jgi:hypothetical protein
MAFDSFKGLKFTAITASALTKKKEPYRKIPSVLREGRKSRKNKGFFDYNLILSSSDKSIESPIYDDTNIHIEENETTGEVGVYISASLFRNMMNDYLLGSLPPSSYASISASFFEQIAQGVENMPPDEAYVGILTDIFEPGSVGSGSEITEPINATFDSIMPGIADSSTGNAYWTIVNNSTNCLSSYFVPAGVPSDKVSEGTGNNRITHQKLITNALTASGLSHLTRSFLNDDNLYIQSTYIPTWSLLLTPHHADYSMWALTSSYSSSQDKGFSASEAMMTTEYDTIQPTWDSPGFELASRKHYYNRNNADDGQYYYATMKAVMMGEFSGSQVNDNAPQETIVFFPSNSVVRSGSFKYAPETSGAAHATSSTDIREIYYISGSGGPSGSYIPSSNFGKNDFSISGSHIFSDSTLQTPADPGFYYANEIIAGVYHRVYGCFNGFYPHFDYSTNKWRINTSGSYFNTASSDANTTNYIFKLTRFTSSSFHNV